MELFKVLLMTSWVVTATTSPTPLNRRLSSRWTDLPRVGGGPIQEHSAAATDSHLYLLGGMPPDANNNATAVPSTNTFEAYSFEEKVWKSLTPIPKAFTHINAAAVDGKIYVLGGLTGDGEGLTWYPAADCFVYDPATGAWETLPSMPEKQGRGASAVGVSGSIVYLAGGLWRLELFPNGTQESLDMVTAYDTKAGTWTTLPSLPAPRDHVGGAVINRTFYVIGGRDRGAANLRNTTWTLDLDSPSDGWAVKAEMPTARGGFAMGVIGDYLGTFGGLGNEDPGSNGVFNSSEIYDVKEDSWFKLPAMPHPRHGNVAATVEDRIYIPGGGIAGGAAPVDTFDYFEFGP
ncbi:galactose oxidase [Hypoxylon trugodes]|uniref:galactose oxidase n=1 Tax=Hypoxylon trugodes TaxID=326681 RepID=UPI00219DDC4C|nr:galactose oxidase [Hypoxylon trugodes]KAI1385693.1 galactose oxidase [Hypoxylon trugodes]